MDTPTPTRLQSAKRLIGALIIGIGGLLLLNQFMAQVAPSATAEQKDGLHQTDHHRAPPNRTQHIVEA